MKPLAIDLFCGAGGFSEGILQAGFHILFSSDINVDVMKTYTNRHEQLGLHQGKNTHFSLSDIKSITGNKIFESISNLEIFKGKSIPEIDVIFGGPPCQGFSRAGRRKKDDPRNQLFKEYVRVVSEISPKYVVMENVLGFLDTQLDGFIGVSGVEYPDNSLVPDILMNEFNSIGYGTIEPMILDASDYGVPQRRRRVIFIAYRNRVGDRLAIPEPPEPLTAHINQRVTVRQAISDLIKNTKSKSSKSKYQVQSRTGRTPTINGDPLSHYGLPLNHELSKHTTVVQERFSLFKEGETTEDIIHRILTNGIDLTKYPGLKEHCIKSLGDIYTDDDLVNKYLNGDLDNNLITQLLTKKRTRFRLNPDHISPTIVTLPDDYLSPFENRILTVREMARLQSFDDSFEFKGKRTTGGQRRKVEAPQYTQVGNAVPPLLAKAIALKIKEAVLESQSHLIQFP